MVWEERNVVVLEMRRRNSEEGAFESSGTVGLKVSRVSDGERERRQSCGAGYCMSSILRSGSVGRQGVTFGFAL